MDLIPGKGEKEGSEGGKEEDYVGRTSDCSSPEKDLTRLMGPKAKAAHWKNSISNGCPHCGNHTGEAWL